MTNERQRRLMQEALDQVLTDEERNELFKYLDSDQSSATEFNQLRRVDALLRNAPAERAPQRLAATIMARLSATVKAQTQSQMGITPEAVAVALGMVSVVTMPMLVAASWMLINSIATLEALNAVLNQIIGLLLLVLKVLQVFLEQAQQLVSSNPQAAAALLTLIPVTLLAMARYIMAGQDTRASTMRRE